MGPTLPTPTACRGLCLPCPRPLVPLPLNETTRPKDFRRELHRQLPTLTPAQHGSCLPWLGACWISPPCKAQDNPHTACPRLNSASPTKPDFLSQPQLEPWRHSCFVSFSFMLHSRLVTKSCWLDLRIFVESTPYSPSLHSHLRDDHLSLGPWLQPPQWSPHSTAQSCDRELFQRKMWLGHTAATPSERHPVVLSPQLLNVVPKAWPLLLTLACGAWVRPWDESSPRERT